MHTTNPEGEIMSIAWKYRNILFFKIEPSSGSYYIPRYTFITKFTAFIISQACYIQVSTEMCLHWL